MWRFDVLLICGTLLLVATTSSGEASTRRRAPPWRSRRSEGVVQVESADVTILKDHNATKQRPWMSRWSAGEASSRRRFRWMAASNATASESSSSTGSQRDASLSSDVGGAMRWMREPKGSEISKSDPNSDTGWQQWLPVGKKQDEGVAYEASGDNKGVQVLELAKSKNDVPAEEETVSNSTDSKGSLDVLVVNPFDSLARWQQSWFLDRNETKESDTDDKDNSQPEHGTQMLNLIQSKLDSEDSGKDGFGLAEQAKNEEEPGEMEKRGRSLGFGRSAAENNATSLERLDSEEERLAAKAVTQEESNIERLIPDEKDKLRNASDFNSEKDPNIDDSAKEGPGDNSDTIQFGASRESHAINSSDFVELEIEEPLDEDKGPKLLAVESLQLLDRDTDSEEKLQPVQEAEGAKEKAPNRRKVPKGSMLELVDPVDDLEKQDKEAEQKEEDDKKATKRWKGWPPKLKLKKAAAPKQSTPVSPARNETSQAEPAQATNTTLSPLQQTTGSPPAGLIAQPLQHAPSMIVVGGAPNGHPYGSAAGVRRQTQPSTSAILIEAVASIVSVALRVWFLSALTKWWAEEESMKPIQHFVWEQLNDRYTKDESALQAVLQTPPRDVSERRWRHRLSRERRRERKLLASKNKKRVGLRRPMASFERTVVVVELGGESLNIPYLKQVVTFILTQHRQMAFGSHNTTAKELEVVVLVESPGGAVQDFGLAAAQVSRLSREEGILTTVCVDKVAASGGYMIASQAKQLLAAPFAIVGSIGVIREGMNWHDALEKYGIRPLVLKAGDSKAPLTSIGPVTKKDLKTAQQTLDTMHKAFQNLVVQGRPVLADTVNSVCTGDIYLGQDAVDLHLIDRVLTSEEYLLERIQAGDRVLKIHRSHQHHAARHRRLFSPLDFIREKSRPVRAALSELSSPRGNRDNIQVESMVTKMVSAYSAFGFVNYLVRNRLFPGARS